MFNLGLEYSDLKEIKLQSELNKTMIVPLNGPLNRHEIDTVNNVLNIQEVIKELLFYTGSALSDGNGKEKVDTSTIGGIYNDGIKRYSDKYVKKKDSNDEKRKLTDYPFNSDFMPSELKLVIKGSSSKRLMLCKLNNGNAKRRYVGKSGDVDEDNSTENLTEEELTKMALERLRNIVDIEEENGTGASGANGNGANNNLEEEMDDEDDEFDDDDDDDDYNAEKYFDDGDDFGGEDFGGDDDEAAF